MSSVVEIHLMRLFYFCNSHICYSWQNANYHQLDNKNSVYLPSLMTDWIQKFNSKSRFFSFQILLVFHFDESKYFASIQCIFILNINVCVCLFSFHVGFKLEDEKCLNLSSWALGSNRFVCKCSVCCCSQQADFNVMKR